MTINGSGIRDTVRVLGINKNTVISTLKKESRRVSVNPKFNHQSGEQIVYMSGEEAELDEQWSYVGKKFDQCSKGRKKLDT